MSTRIEIQALERRNAFRKLSIGGGFAIGAAILCQVIETMFPYF